jgi:hypothetical protein
MNEQALIIIVIFDANNYHPVLYVRLSWDFPYNLIYLSSLAPLSLFSNRIPNLSRKLKLFTVNVLVSYFCVYMYNRG